MIFYIKGKPSHILENSVVIDNNGIGYHVFVTPATLGKIKHDENIKVFTYMNVKEDCMQLYGFFSNEELSVFNSLITVSGIGPKAAMSILNTMEPSQIILAIVTEDASALSKPVGVGKKTAQRIILELKDKMKSYESVPDNMFEDFKAAEKDSIKKDAIEALLVLGYGKSEAVQSVMKASYDGATTEEIIKAALKILSVR